MVCIVHIEPCDRTRRVVARVLAGAGFACVPAASLPSRWDVGLPVAVDLVIADIGMLQPDPEAGIAELRRRAPGARVLLTTGGHPRSGPGTDPSMPGAIPCVGCRIAEGVLLKPFENDQLVCEVSRLLALPTADTESRLPDVRCAMPALTNGTK